MPKVLVVEDGELIRKIIQITLIKMGCDVVLAIDGEDGINKIQSEQPDLVIMDLLMPNMGGQETLQIIRQNPATHDLPVYIATATLEPKKEKELQEMGANGLVTKPLTPQILMSIIQDYL